MPNEEDEQTKEGARLLYVAISRAKKRLCVTHFQCPWEECTDWCNCSKYTRRLSRFVAQESIRGFFYPYPKDEKKE
jgi:superfamily I DNA/RNA helicase